LFFHYQAHRHTRDWGFQGYTGIHHRSVPPQMVAIDDEPLDSVISATIRVVGKVRLIWQHRSSATCQRACRSRRLDEPKYPTWPTE
jgi:hypothetical protein